MTSKMICPFCRRALARHSVQGQEYGICRGENCPSKRVFLPIEIWQALIQAKQDLEIARSALESISGIRGNIEDYYGGVSIHYQQMVLHMDEIATNALEIIGKHNE